MGLKIFHGIFPDISHIQSKCGHYLGKFHGILSVPHNIVMDMINVIISFGKMIVLYTTCNVMSPWAHNITKQLHDGVSPKKEVAIQRFE